MRYWPMVACVTGYKQGELRCHEAHTKRDGADVQRESHDRVIS